LALAAALGLAVLAQVVWAAETKCDPNYDNFGKAFIEKYCLGCHSAAKSGLLARKGAPKDANFDKLEDIKKFRAKIIKLVGDGVMPPMSTKPAADEKAKVKAWLDCDV
jgi:uncharacterized membrane protein